MRFLLLSFYSFVLTVILGSPIDFSSNDLNLDSSETNLEDNQPTQLTVPETQTPPQPDNVEKIALGNVDPTIETTDLDTLDTNPNSQYEPTLDTTGEQLSQIPTEPSPENSVAPSPKEKNCVTRSLEEKRPLCDIPYLPEAIFFGMYLGRNKIMQVYGQIVAKVKKEKAKWPKGESAKKESPKVAKARAKLQEQWAKEVEADRLDDLKNNPENKDENADDNKNAMYKEYIRTVGDWNPLFLQKSTEEALLDSQADLQGRNVEGAAKILILVLDAFGLLVFAI